MKTLTRRRRRSLDGSACLSCVIGVAVANSSEANTISAAVVGATHKGTTVVVGLIQQNNTTAKVEIFKG